MPPSRKRPMSDLEPAQDAFDRMSRANKRGTGCHLTAEMIEALSRTFLGEIWVQERPPRESKPEGEE